MRWKIPGLEAKEEEKQQSTTIAKEIPCLEAKEEKQKKKTCVLIAIENPLPGSQRRGKTKKTTNHDDCDTRMCSSPRACAHAHAHGT